MSADFTAATATSRLPTASVKSLAKRFETPLKCHRNVSATPNATTNAEKSPIYDKSCKTIVKISSRQNSTTSLPTERSESAKTASSSSAESLITAPLAASGSKLCIAIRQSASKTPKVSSRNPNSKSLASNAPITIAKRPPQITARNKMNSNSSDSIKVAVVNKVGSGGDTARSKPKPKPPPKPTKQQLANAVAAKALANNSILSSSFSSVAEAASVITVIKTRDSPLVSVKTIKTTATTPTTGTGTTTTASTEITTVGTTITETILDIAREQLASFSAPENCVNDTVTLAATDEQIAGSSLASNLIQPSVIVEKAFASDLEASINQSQKSFLSKNKATVAPMSRLIQRPKIKPPPPKATVNATQGSHAISTPIVVDKSIESQQEQWEQQHAQQQAQPYIVASTPSKTCTVNRVIRKPSLRPPPPPTSARTITQSAVASTSTTVSEVDTTTARVERVVTSPLFHLPKMPAIPPPLPPSLEAQSAPPSIIYGAQQNDNKFDELYEEIEHAFNEEYASKLKSSDEKSAEQNVADRYVPKFRKKSSARHSPPGYYRTSVYATSRMSQDSTSPELQHQYDPNSHVYNILHYNDSRMDDPNYDSAAASGGMHTTSATLPKEFCRNSERSASVTDADISVLNRDAKRESYRRTRFQRRQPQQQAYGRFDTWSVSVLAAGNINNNDRATNNNWSNNISTYYGSECSSSHNYGSVDESGGEYGNCSVENYHIISADGSALPSPAAHRSEPPKLRHYGDTSSRYTKTHNGGYRRRPLSELWRFKSELQLNLSRKMSRIYAKVENTVSGAGELHSITSASCQQQHHRSTFYTVDSRTESPQLLDTVVSGRNAMYVRPHIAFGDGSSGDAAEKRVYYDDWSSSFASSSDEEARSYEKSVLLPAKLINNSKDSAVNTNETHHSRRCLSEEQQQQEQQQRSTSTDREKSLLAEIENAYFELQLKRNSTTTTTSATSALLSSAVNNSDKSELHTVGSHLTASTNGAASAVADGSNEKGEAPKMLDKNASQRAEIERRTMNDNDDESRCAEQYDKMRNVTQLPSSSSSSMSSITENSELATIVGIASPKSSTTSAPLASGLTLEIRAASCDDIIAAGAGEQVITIGGGEEEDDEDEIEADAHSVYTSWLPAPQPLYQYYMKQEQERLFGSGSAAAVNLQPKFNAKLQRRSTIESLISANANLQQQPSTSVAPRSEKQAAASTTVIVTNSDAPYLSTVMENGSGFAENGDGGGRKKTITVVNAPLMIDENEADSVCDSNEPDDVVSVSSIRRQSSSVSTDSGRGADTLSHVTSNTSTSMRRERLTAGSVYGSQRSLWCELPEVKSAGLLDALDKHSKRLQEAYFEVITSEASYLRSINVLMTKFMASPELLGSKSSVSAISSAERKQLFSNVQAIRDCSERLLCDLEHRLKENIILSDVCDILCEHFEKHFDAYVKYCSNQVYQDRTLKRLKLSNAQFLNCVQKIESDRQCQGLDMRSFLMLPMQRITRYPLLLYAIIDNLEPASSQHTMATRALMLANQVVRNCNEGARRMERTEQLLEIERRLVYKSADLKRIPLVSSGRYIVKSGMVTQLFERSRSKTKLNVLQSKQRARSLYLFLFNDLLMIAKQKPNGFFVCKDYAARRFIVIEPVEPHSHKVPTGAVSALPGKPHLFFCILMNNARGKQVELLLNTESESDRERWLSAMRPPTCANPDEKIYAEWDCPQAIAAHNYEAAQEDELELETGDLVNILRKMPDGWYYGERARGGKGGWFPSSYVQLILNDHVRANNYRQRLRLIQAVSDYRLQHQNSTIRDRRSGSSKRASLPASALNSSASFCTTISTNSNGSISSAPFGVASYEEHQLSASPRSSQNEHQLISRLRRLSNPKTLFSTTNE